MTTNSEPLGSELEAILWAAADKLRGSIDASEYKNVVLGLVFLKYVSDRFEEYRAFLVEAGADPDSSYYVEDEERRADQVEDRDEYTAENIFWIPIDARWDVLQASAKQADIGQRIDRAMDAIEAENRRLKGILPKGYGRESLDPRRLGELVDLVGAIGFGGGEHEGKDVLGRVYEYFMRKFDLVYGRAAGEFYTPRHLVRLLVEMLEPYEGRVYDPCCGSGGMFVQSAEFVAAHGGDPDKLSIYGQELNSTTWRLAQMNLAIHGLSGNLGDQWGDTFHNDKHPDLRADYIITNPPFNISDWGQDRLRDDRRWTHGVPPASNANFGWVQHLIHHLAPGGTAGFVLANGSLSSMSGGEGTIRQKLVESDLVDCIVTLPGQLFYTTQIPVSLWFISKARDGDGGRDRRGEVLFIDGRKCGEMVDRTHRILTDEDISKIADTYHAWKKGAGYGDVAGFCKAASLAEIEEHGFVLTPGRYVGVAPVEDDGEPFDERMTRLTGQLAEQFAKGQQLEDKIRDQLAGIGYDI